MVTVRVPATSANMGSGFDCVGVALQLYNTIRAEETDGGLLIEFKDASSRFLPSDERNLVYRAMTAVFERVGYTPRGLHIIQDNLVPVTRGLGSSSTGIVGGILAANEIAGARLSQQELINIAAAMEGHPDNVTPAITGGMAVAVKDAGIKYISFPVNNDKLSFAVYVPPFPLRTKAARSVLPRTVRHRDAVFNVGRSALLASAMLTEQYDLLATALQDRLHQYYRRRLIGGSGRIFYKALQLGAIGTYVSGAGSSIVSIVKKEREEQFRERMHKYMKDNYSSWRFMLVQADNDGAAVVKEGSI